MSIDPIAPITVPSLTPTSGTAEASSTTVDFASVIDSAIERASQDVSAAEGALQGMASGKPVELHDMMIALENARLSVQTLIQVRNRVIEAYQEVSRMQI